MSDPTQPQNPSMTPQDPNAESPAHDALSQENAQPHSDAPLDAAETLASALADVAVLLDAQRLKLIVKDGLVCKNSLANRHTIAS